MKTIFQHIARGLVGLMMINGGANKLFNYLPPPADMSNEMVALFNAVNAFGWLLPLVAVVELIGGILFIIPKTKLLGALMLFPICIGILMVHIFQAPEGLPIAIVLLFILAWIGYEKRDKLVALLS